MIRVGDNNASLKENEIKIGEQYKLFSKRKLGSGAFGDIYYGLNFIKNEEVAIKLVILFINQEPSKIKNSQLVSESKLYQTIEGGEGIPKIHWFGTQGKFNIMVIDLLGKSLEELFSSCKRIFSVKTTIMLARQIIDRIEYIHSKSFIHRDVKPDNFVMGINNKKQNVYIIDFGLGKRYRDPISGKHIAYKDGKSLTGTARYASLNTHLGIEQSRRDDLESFTYVLIYFLKGSLPWQGLKAKNNKEKYDRITDKKLNTKVALLCKDLPEDLLHMVNYTRGLKFDEKPDYEYLRKMIMSMAEKEKVEFDNKFDWSILESKENIVKKESDDQENTRNINKDFYNKINLNNSDSNNKKLVPI